MSHSQENPESTQDYGNYTEEETPALEVAQVSEAAKETSVSSYPLWDDQGNQTCIENKGLEIAQVAAAMKKTLVSFYANRGRQTYIENQSPEVAQVSKVVKETYVSSCPLKDDQCSQTYVEKQGPEAEQVSEGMEKETFSSCDQSYMQRQGPEDAQACEIVEPSSSQSPTPSHSDESSISDSSSTSDDLQSSPSSTTSSSKSDDPQSSQDQGNPFSLTMPNPMNTPEDALANKVDFLVNYMLYRYQVKKLIRMEDILNIVIKEDAIHYNTILMRAARRMEVLFGLDVKEVDPVNHSYGLFIKLGLTYDGMRSDEYSFPKTGFLILILGVIYMKGNRATEEEMWEVLNSMGIHSGVSHSIFGDPRELIIKEFVEEQYLEYRQVVGSEPLQNEYVWGPRARAETSKMKVLEFVAKLHGTDPSSFPSQYEEAVLEEEERTLTMILNTAALASMATASTSSMSSMFPPPPT